MQGTTGRRGPGALQRAARVMRDYRHETLVLAGAAAWLALFAAARVWPVLLDTVNALYFVICAVFVGDMWRTAAHPLTPAPAARAWRLLAVAAGCIIVAGAAWTIWATRYPLDGTPVWSRVADVLYAPLAIVAFLSFPRHPRMALRHTEAAFDAALLAVGTLSLTWYFTPPLAALAPFQWITLIAWGEAALGWLVVLAAGVAYLRASTVVTRSTLALWMMSQVLFIISGLLLDQYQAGDLVDVVFFAAWIFRWASARHALRQWERLGDRPLGTGREYQSGIAPAAFVSGAYVLLLAAVFADRSQRTAATSAIAVIALCMTWLLVARHLVHEAATRRQVRAVAAQKEQFRAVMDSVSDYIFVAETEGRLTWLSASSHRAFAPGGQATFASLVHPDETATVRAWLSDLATDPAAPPVLARLRRADGSWVHVELRGHNRLADGNVRGIVINGRDRTMEITLEGRVRHAEKLSALHEMAGRIAHAFNNVLTVVQGHAELLAANPALDAAWHVDVGEMRTAAARGAAITRQLLGFSGRQVLHAVPVDVAAVVDEALPGWRRLLPSGTSVRREGDAGALRAVVDRAQLEQVLLNLVVNARDAMPAGGDIVLGVARGEAADGSRRVVLSVRDTGIGMDADHVTHIFEPFFTTKLPGVGTGLGLAMVDTIVRRAGGELSVQSAPGAGATFTIALPATGAGRVSMSVPVLGDAADVSAPMVRGVVLLVDDEDAVRNVTTRMLTRVGFDVHACSGGAEALDAAAEPGAAFDVVVTDMMMPGTSGRELIERLVVLYPQLPIVVITGFTADAYTRSPLPVQVQRIIDKPFEAAELIGAVRRAVSGRAGQGGSTTAP